MILYSVDRLQFVFVNTGQEFKKKYVLRYILTAKKTEILHRLYERFKKKTA